jgi:hypothetical protein
VRAPIGRPHHREAIVQRLLALFVALACIAAANPARAGEEALAARQILESGQMAAGEQAMAARLAADPGNNEARFGLGLVRFARAIERFGQRQYRYGLHAPRTLSLPILRLPLPVNPAPEELTYEKQRETLKALLGDLSGVEATLAPMSDAPVKIALDLNAIRFDLRGDGKPDELETLASLMTRLGMTQAPRAAAQQFFEVDFDNADALWLRGYVHVLSASLEFVLAYDWREAFERAGQLFYPRIAPPPFGAAGAAPFNEPSRFFLADAPQFADLIALVHEIRWPLAEAARLKQAHADLKQVVALNRLMWKAILARGDDDDHVWIPGPQQKNGVLAGMPVTQEKLDAWLKALDTFDAALDGRLLLPHWRFAQGVNLKRVFFEPRPFDLVLWATGQAAAPYLEPGPVLPGEAWSDWQRAFNDNFLGYAIWFN